MLDSKSFDLWADGYDRSVSLCDDTGSYPFAGYREVLGAIYSRVRERGYRRVLDIGFGTGILASKLYADGLAVSGVDFSPRMIELARLNLPDARLVEQDFSRGVDGCFPGEVFDCIISTYALHHIEAEAKPAFIAELMGMLAPGGEVLIGDVAFNTQAGLESCRIKAGDDWDADESYFVVDGLRDALSCRMEFTPYSFCAGVIRLYR